MGSLSGQTIQSTYQGLLKLSDSTTGITNSYQQIQDGLGNDTGIKIKNNSIFDNAHQTTTNFKPKSLGSGFSNTAINAPTYKNYLVAQLFLDYGKYSYSSITFNIRTATTTNDTLQVALYSSQMTANGVLPKDKISDTVSIPLNATNQVTVPFTNNFSFSGSPGLNFLMLLPSTTATTFSFRPAGVTTTFLPSGLLDMNGLNGPNNGIYFIHCTRALGTANNVAAIYGFSGLTSFASAYTSSQISSAQSVLSNPNNIGFILNVV